MATYDELLSAAGNTNLINRVRVATFVAATAIMSEPDTAPLHAERLQWAKQVFADPAAHGLRMIWPVLAQNKTAPLASITGASDAAIQTAVDAAVNTFASGV